MLPHPSTLASRVLRRVAPPRAPYDESFKTPFGPFDESFEPFDESFEPFDESFEPFDEVDEGIDVTIAENVDDSVGSVRSVRFAGSSAVLGSGAVLGSSAAAPPPMSPEPA